MSTLLDNSKRRRWLNQTEGILMDVAPTIAICSQPLITVSTVMRVALLVLLIIVYFIPRKLQEKLKEEIKSKLRNNNNNNNEQDTSEEDGSTIPPLFPNISNVMEDETATAKLCSTGLTTRLLPFRNKNGDIEWAFTDDERKALSESPATESSETTVKFPNDVVQGSELDEFKIKIESPERMLLTPTTSNSLHSSDLIISKQADSSQSDNTPMTGSPFSENGDKSSSNSEVGEEKHQCPHCNASFKIRGYLTRHLKKHATKKAYKCPFYEHSIYVDENNLTHKCHPNGGFSRRDTYKTHLKLRHFTYPEGVKTKDRATSPGYCSLCNEYFPSSEIWSEIHVEGGECKFLPSGFTGKLRIKNKIRKQQQKQKSKGQQILVEAATAAIMTELTLPSKSSHTYGTPQLYIHANPGYHPNTNSVNNMVNTNQYCGGPPQVLQRSNSPAYSVHSISDSHPGMMYMNTPLLVPSSFQEFQENEYFDYDDDYCLDEDQLVHL